MFSSFQSRTEDWVELNEAGQQDYLPVTRTSLKFESRHCVSGNETTSVAASLGLFESTLQNNAATIFAGGPIWASAWCPIKNGNDSHVVALYAEKVKYLCTVYI